MYKNDIVAFCKNYVVKTKKIKECIIYDEEDNLEENQIDFKKVLQFDGDLTGYEAGCNEIRVNDFIDFNNINNIDIIQILTCLKKELSAMYPNKQFCVIISIDEMNITIRFHIY